jgi:tetratricopeptide (TPR) repeat protein
MNLDIKKLNLKEKEIVFSLSVIQFAMYSIPELWEMFQIGENEQYAFFDTVHDLSVKSYLKRDKDLYGLKPGNAHFIRKNYNPAYEDCSKLINNLLSKLESGNLDYEKQFVPVYQKLEFLLNNMKANSLHMAHLSFVLSNNLVHFKKFEEALKYNQMAVEISESIDNRHPSIAIYYRNKAVIHKKLGNTQMSIFYSLKDIEILEKNAGRYDDLLPGSYFNLSKTYEDIHNYEKAIEYNLKAIQFEKKRKHQRFVNLSGLYHNLAYYYLKVNNLQNASLFIDKAVEFFSKEKITNNEQYKHLIRDQRRFKSLFKAQKFVVKYKYHILILLFLILFSGIWGLIRIFG